jgi:hypothetical protein
MGVDQVVLLARLMLQEVVILLGPVLAVAIPVTGAPAAGHGNGAFPLDALDVAPPRALHHQFIN